LIDVAFAVGTALERGGFSAVLTGGSAATFHSASYQSLDLDFVITLASPNAEMFARVLADIGYLKNGRQFSHRLNRYTLDFPRGPLMIGIDEISRWETHRRDDQTLHVLTRTDSVRDRLAAFYHWNDRSSLATACAVAVSGPIDIQTIRAWSEREASLEKCREFERVLELATKSKPEKL
jgi:hypothetical protein